MTYTMGANFARNLPMTFLNNTAPGSESNLANLLFSKMNNSGFSQLINSQNSLNGISFGLETIPTPKPFALPLPIMDNIAAPMIAPVTLPALSLQETPIPVILPETNSVPAYNGGSTGGYSGDPHFTGFDGESYDVMGQDGKTYNILSDKGFQYNARFGRWGGTTATINSAVGLQVGRNQIAMDIKVNNGAPTVNGTTLKEGETVQLDDQGSVTLEKGNLITKTKEYTTTLMNRGQYIDSDVKINEGVNPLADGVAPHGILGQTADGIAGAHVGINNKNIAYQGGTVIDGTVENYEVNGLFDTGFNQFNRFNKL